MPDEYFDDSYDDEESWKKKQGKKKKLLTNPEGPYKLDITYRGIKFNVTIENVTFDRFKLCAIMEDQDYDENVEDSKYQPLILKLNQYLDSEGYFMAAKKHNLFFK